METYSLISVAFSVTNPVIFIFCSSVLLILWQHQQGSLIPCSWIKASGYYLHILIEIGDPFSDFCCFQWYSPLISMFFPIWGYLFPFRIKLFFGWFIALFGLVLQENLAYSLIKNWSQDLSQGWHGPISKWIQQRCLSNWLDSFEMDVTYWRDGHEEDLDPVKVTAPYSSDLWLFYEVKTFSLFVWLNLLFLLWFWYL